MKWQGRPQSSNIVDRRRSKVGSNRSKSDETKRVAKVYTPSATANLIDPPTPRKKPTDAARKKLAGMTRANIPPGRRRGDKHK